MSVGARDVFVTGRGRLQVASPWPRRRKSEAVHSSGASRGFVWNARRPKFAVVAHSCPGCFLCTDRMLSPAVFDTLAALALLFIALVGAYAPRLLYHWGKKGAGSTGRSLLYVLGNMLSAGVMVSAGFVHLLGAAVKQLNPGAVFPLAAFLCGLGFIMTLVADHAVERLSSRTGWSVVSCRSAGGAPLEGTPNGTGEVDSCGLQTVAVDGPTAEENSKQTPAANGVGKTPVKEAVEVQPFEVDSTQAQHVELAGAPAERPTSVEARAGGRNDREPLFDGDHIDSATGDPQILQRSVSVGGQSIESRAGSLTAKIPKLKQVSFLTAVLMAVALCFHSILEGMAMGAQESIVDTLHIFIAIFAHKGLAAYALGSSLVDSGANRKRFWTVIAIFSLATPVGIALGRVVAGVSESGPAAGLSALASGTFLYVAFMEVIPKELSNPEYGFIKLGMLCLGYGAMSLLALWA